MRLLLSICVATLLACTSLYADQPTGLPPEAKEEVTRLNHDVEELGTIQAGPDAGVRRAMAPPEDDSSKWFVNFIGAGTASTDQEKAATKLLLDDIKALKFAEYVKPEDPAHSWGNWQEYRIDDDLQKDWLDGIRPRLKTVGIPAIVIQPPANGKFGSNKVVVCVVGGYNGIPEQFKGLIRTRVEAYIHKHGYDGTLATAQLAPRGHAQSAESPVGARPPFNLPEPVAFPDAKDLPRFSMTFEQIRKKFPDVPAEDAAHYAEQQLTEQEITDAEAKLTDGKKKVTPADGGAFGEILLVGILVIVVLAGAWYIQKQSQAAKTAKPSELTTS